MARRGRPSESWMAEMVFVRYSNFRHAFRLPRCSLIEYLLEVIRELDSWINQPRQGHTGARSSRVFFSHFFRQREQQFWILRKAELGLFGEPPPAVIFLLLFFRLI